MRECATTLAAEMTFAESEFLTRVLAERNFPGIHLEVGTAAGGTLVRMMQSVGARFVVVDPMRYFPDQLAAVQRNLASHDLDVGRVEFRVESSVQAREAALAAGECFDFILVDANHKWRHIIRDIRWAALLRPGGLVAFHDYSERFPGVCHAVDLLRRRNPHFRVVGQAGSLLILEKGAALSDRFATPVDLARADLISLWGQFRRALAKRLGR